MLKSQVAFNRASYSLPLISSVVSNLVGLAIFLVLSAALLWAHMRAHVALCAEAVAVTKTTDMSQVRCIMAVYDACLRAFFLWLYAATASTRRGFCCAELPACQAVVTVRWS